MFITYIFVSHHIGSTLPYDKSLFYLTLAYDLLGIVKRFTFFGQPPVKKFLESGHKNKKLNRRPMRNKVRYKSSYRCVTCRTLRLYHRGRTRIRSVRLRDNILTISSHRDRPMMLGYIHVQSGPGKVQLDTLNPIPLDCVFRRVWDVLRQQYSLYDRKERRS